MGGKKVHNTRVKVNPFNLKKNGIDFKLTADGLTLGTLKITGASVIFKGKNAEPKQWTLTEFTEVLKNA